MNSRVEYIQEKKLIGKKLKMSFAENKTADLWRSFMPAKKNIRNALSPDLISMQIYSSPLQVLNFDVHAPFEKWACVETDDIDYIPEGMESCTLPAGWYSVFDYKGNAQGAASAFQYIFTEWLPASPYELDDRPHFEILGDKYKNGDPNSEEEIWIPIKPRSRV